MIYRYLLSIFLATSLLTSHLCAHDKTTPYTKLADNVLYLQKLANSYSDKTQVQDAQYILLKSRKVLQKGHKASPRSIKKALKATYKSIQQLKSRPQTIIKAANSRAVSDVTKHINRITTEMNGIMAEVASTTAYNEPIAITAVPYTITNPGKYYIPQDLTYNGAATAITVAASNVMINFYNNSLIVTNPSATGILVKNVNEFTLSNSIIQGSVNGLVLNNVSGARIESSFIKNAGMTCSSSTGIFITNSSFIGSDTANQIALSLTNSSSHISLDTCTFSNWQYSIQAQDASGLQISSCLVAGSETLSGNLLQLTNTNNTQITNSSFGRQTALAASDGILFESGSGCTLNNVVVSVASTTTSTYKSAAVHIGDFNTILANDCMILGSNAYSLLVENGSNIHLVDCQVMDATTANVYLDAQATGCLLKNCKISDALGSGIIIASGATLNAINGCELSNNSGNGIVISQNAPKNLVFGNNVFDNQNFGIVNNEATTSIFSNISCNNSGSDCPSGGVTPAQAPGVAPLTPGSNICCVP
ncbi:MAG: right-handed parallel beta-helix repeat-containing protein [Chlamydiales bacterium]|nr:right-handed parallel beta-helix repeat-containing protein [Chlamydiales bacterium]